MRDVEGGIEPRIRERTELRESRDPGTGTFVAAIAYDLGSCQRACFFAVPCVNSLAVDRRTPVPDIELIARNAPRGGGRRNRIGESSERIADTARRT